MNILQKCKGEISLNDSTLRCESALPSHYTLKTLERALWEFYNSKELLLLIPCKVQSQKNYNRDKKKKKITWALTSLINTHHFPFVISPILIGQTKGFAFMIH